MAKPNSLTTLIRRYICHLIEPLPPEGEVWCNDCTLNGGETLAISSAIALHHLELHRDEKSPHVSIIGRKIDTRPGHD